MQFLSRPAAPLSAIVPRRIRRGDDQGLRARVAGDGRFRRAWPDCSQRWPTSSSTRCAFTPTSSRRMCATRCDRCGRTPGFTFTAILVAALGIGATTATFSIADHVLLRPLPFDDPDRLVRITEDHTSIGYPRMEPSPPNYLDWKRLATSFEHRSLQRRFQESRRQRRAGTNLRRLDGRRRLRPARASGGDRPNAALNAMPRTRRRIRWSSAIGCGARASPRIPTVLGRTLTLDTMTLVIVGVMPPDFFFPLEGHRVSGALLRFSPTTGDDSRGNNYLQVMARLKPGVTRRTGAIGDANRCRSDRAAVPEGTGRQERQRQSVARRRQPADPADVVGAGRRRDLPAADRVHQPREPAVVARALAADGDWRCAPPSAPASIDWSGR